MFQGHGHTGTGGDHAPAASRAAFHCAARTEGHRVREKLGAEHSVSGSPPTSGPSSARTARPGTRTTSPAGSGPPWPTASSAEDDPPSDSSDVSQKAARHESRHE
jgi:hypothetical protein